VVVLQVATRVRATLTIAPEMFASSIGKTEASRKSRLRNKTTTKHYQQNLCRGTTRIMCYPDYALAEAL